MQNQNRASRTTQPSCVAFGFSFVVLARRWRRFVDERLAASGLSDATWAPLVHLSELDEAVTQNKLAALIGLDASSLVRLIDILCERGLVERLSDTHDRRVKRVRLTAAGRAEVVRIRQLLGAVEAQLLSDSTEEEIASVLRVFERISRRIDSLRVESGK